MCKIERALPFLLSLACVRSFHPLLPVCLLVGWPLCLLLLPLSVAGVHLHLRRWAAADWLPGVILAGSVTRQLQHNLWVGFEFCDALSKI